MIAAGSVSSRSSPRARVSQSPQAPAIGSGDRRTDGTRRIWARSATPSVRRRGHRGARVGRVGVSRIGQQVRARSQVAHAGADAVPAQQGGRGGDGADQVEGVPGAQRGRIVGEFLEHARAVGRGAERQLPRLRRRAGSASAPRPFSRQATRGMSRRTASQVPPACLSMPPIAASPASAARAGARDGHQLVAYAEQHQRHPLPRRKAENNCAHASIMTAARWTQEPAVAHGRALVLIGQDGAAGAGINSPGLPGQNRSYDAAWAG